MKGRKLTNHFEIQMQKLYLFKVVFFSAAQKLSHSCFYSYIRIATQSRKK